MAAKKKTDKGNEGSKTKPGKALPEVDGAAPSKHKVDDLIEIICEFTDSEGFFHPKDVQAKVRGTALAKSASIIHSNLRLQGFRQGDTLRIPISEGHECIKKFINLASNLRRKGTKVPFEDAVALILTESESLLDAESPVDALLLQPISEVVPPVIKPQPVPQVSESKAADSPSAEKDFRALYEEARERVMRLEAELIAYKDICSRLIVTLGS